MAQKKLRKIVYEVYEVYEKMNIITQQPLTLTLLGNLYEPILSILKT